MEFEKDKITKDIIAKAIIRKKMIEKISNESLSNLDQGNDIGDSSPKSNVKLFNFRRIAGYAAVLIPFIMLGFANLFYSDSVLLKEGISVLDKNTIRSGGGNGLESELLTTWNQALDAFDRKDLSTTLSLCDSLKDSRIPDDVDWLVILTLYEQGKYTDPNFASKLSDIVNDNAHKYHENAIEIHTSLQSWWRNLVF